jgi:hypothetical protein
MKTAKINPYDLYLKDKYEVKANKMVEITVVKRSST